MDADSFQAISRANTPTEGKWKTSGFLFLGVAVAVLAAEVATLAADRTPPYERLAGRMTNGQAWECGRDAAYYDRLTTGGCSAIEWTLKINEEKIKTCVPVNALHVDRTITDKYGVVHHLPKTERYFGQGKRDFTSPLRRPMILPEYETPARYHSEACFVCNRLQKYLSWPVCISTPDVIYEAAN